MQVRNTKLENGFIKVILPKWFNYGNIGEAKVCRDLYANCAD